jgi:hypothetical protein
MSSGTCGASPPAARVLALETHFVEGDIGGLLRVLGARM